MIEESASITIASLAADLSLFMVPLIDEFTKLIVKDDEESTVISPSISWSVKVKVTVPPFEPLVPQSPPSASKNTPEPKVKVQLVKCIFASVFVT